MTSTNGIVPESRVRPSRLTWDAEQEAYVGDSLYFILDERSDAIKIGRGNPEKRLLTLQIGNPNDLRLVASIPNAGWQEAFWHCCWDGLNIRGEWFRWDEALQAAVAAIQSGADWTDHVPQLIVTDRDFDLGEWQEHMLDAMEAYSDFALDEKPMMALTRAAQYAIYDPDFDGRCVQTRHFEALQVLYPDECHVGEIEQLGE